MILTKLPTLDVSRARRHTSLWFFAKEGFVKPFQILVELDVFEYEDAASIVEMLSGKVGGFSVRLNAVIAGWHRKLRPLVKRSGALWIADSRLGEGTSVLKTITALADEAFDYCTINTAAGYSALEVAARSANGRAMKIIGVPVSPSLSPNDLMRLGALDHRTSFLIGSGLGSASGVASEIETQARVYIWDHARLAREAGLAGIMTDRLEPPPHLFAGAADDRPFMYFVTESPRTNLASAAASGADYVLLRQHRLFGGGAGSYEETFAAICDSREGG